MYYLVIAFFCTIGAIISYLFLRPYLDLINNKRKAVKTFLIFFIICAIAAGLTHLLDEETPVSKEVQLLKEDKKIIDQLGSFVSYTYQFVMERDSPAYYKFSLNGTSATIHYSMKVERDSSQKWQMVSLKQDSIVKK